MSDDTSLYCAVIDKFPDGIILTDKNFNIVFVNKAAEQIRHVCKAEKLGKNILECHPEASREKVKRALAFVKGKRTPFRRVVVDSASDRIYENFYQSIETEDNEFQGMTIISKDITDKHKAEQERLQYNQQLQLEVTSLADRLNSLFLESLTSLVFSLEAKDVYTKGHSERVTDMCRKYVQNVYGNSQLLADIELAAKLHDIGKIGITESILNKPGRLTDEEMAMMRRHPEITAQILSPFTNLKDVAKIARHHHERFDGKGYPDGLKGEAIPEGSRILALADAYDAMVSTRPYRTALSVEHAVDEMRKNLGTQFDPIIGATYLNLIETGTI